MNAQDRGIFEKVGPLNRSWLQDLKTLVYEHIRNAIAAAQDEAPPYDPYRYEWLLVEIAGSLDRCLLNRQECQSLEAQAIRAALEYKLFEDTFEVQSRLNNLSTETNSLTAQATAFGNSAKLFGPADAGFQALYAGSQDATGSQIVNESEKRKALAEQLDLTKQHKQDLERRHVTPGHALNFKERREALLRLIVQDITEAFQKARAVQAGIRQQLNIDSDYPFPSVKNDERDTTLLDDLVLWTRSISTLLHDYASKEVVFEMTIPLVAPSKATELSAAAFAAAMRGNGRVSFSLAEALPTQQCVPRLRVRAIALSVGVSHIPRAHPDWVMYTTTRQSCLVFAPKQADPYGGEPIARLPAHVGNIGFYGYSEFPTFHEGLELWNVDPRTGPWEFLFQQFSNSTSNQRMGEHPRANNWMQDLKVHLRFAGVPATDPDAWLNF